jgi:cell wall-associated NlpC family hydrolase
MVNQLLFGESVKIHAVDAEGWMQVEGCWDGYTGSCRSNQFLLLNEPLVESSEFTGDWVEEIIVNQQKLMIPFGSNLSILNNNVSGVPVVYNGNIYKAGSATADAKMIRDLASIFLNTAYLWGGKSVFGIDCSGFVQSVFKMLNISLPRDANTQVNRGEPVGFLQEAICGDLAFFDDEEGKIVHVGIMLNDHEIIHSSGNVRIDPIDNEGIINSTTGKRTHHLRIIKRIISLSLI